MSTLLLVGIGPCCIQDLEDHTMCLAEFLSVHAVQVLMAQATVIGSFNNHRALQRRGANQ